MLAVSLLRFCGRSLFATVTADRRRRRWMWRLAGAGLQVIVAALPVYGSDPERALSVVFSPTSGQVADVLLDSASVTSPKVAGGFSYRVGNHGDFRPLRGKVADGVLQASDDAITLQATIAFDRQMTRIDGRLTSSGENVDLGVQLRFQLPVDASGGTYWRDLRRSDVIDKPSRYAFEETTRYQKPPRMSYYPMIAVTPPRSASGICMAVPLDAPTVYRFAYEEGQGLYVDLDLGLHSAQQGGPHADFSLVIYPYVAAWGMRAAMQGYYDRFPQWFVVRIPPERAGTWFCAVDTQHIGDPEEIGLVFDEHARYRLAWNAGYPICSMEYSEPWNYYDEWYSTKDAGPHPKPSYDEILAHLEQGLNSTKPWIRDGSKAALASAMGTKDGKLHADLRYWDRQAPQGRYWHCIFRTILHPDLPGGMQQYMVQYEYEPVLKAAEKAGAPLGGWYFDSVNLSGPDPDYRTDHFALPSVRLSADPEDGRAMLLGWMADYEAIQQFSDRLHSENRILFGNEMLASLDLAGVSCVHLFDALGIENPLKRYLGTGQARPAEHNDGGILKLRALAYRKPLATLHYDKHDSYEFHWRHCLFYGVYDGPHYVWEDPQAIEAYRPVAKRYVPLVRELNQAGWCPITYARSAELWLERFGGETSGPLYIAVRNSTAATVRGRVELDLGDAALDGSVAATATELISGETVAVDLAEQKAQLATEVAAEDTRVFKFAFTARQTTKADSPQH